jgi:hypothetical protein
MTNRRNVIDVYGNLPNHDHQKEFTGLKRIVIVWVKRLSLGERSWEPIACKTSREAAIELTAARSAGDMAFTATYSKRKRRAAGDRRAERMSED